MQPWPHHPALHCPRALQHGEVLPLKILTYAAVALSLAALLLAFVLLALARALRSNLHSIHRNLIAALFLSQLIFVVGINQTENPVRPRPLPRADMVGTASLAFSWAGAASLPVGRWDAQRVSHQKGQGLSLPWADASAAT